MSTNEHNSAVSRRHFLRLTAASLGGVVLSACGGTPSAEPQPTAETTIEATVPTAPPQDNSATTAISVWYWDQVFDASVEGFQKDHPDITVNFQAQPFADVHDKLLTTFASGSGSPDVTSIAIDRIVKADGELTQIADLF